MYYYDEIRKYLSDLDNSFVKTVSSNFEYLATLCQQFCQCQSIYDHIKPASPVLTQYRSAECRLTKGEDKKTEEDSLSILEKLSIELLWKLYLKSQNVVEEDKSIISSKDTINSLESSFINTFVFSISYKKNFEQFWKSLFDGTSFMNHYSKSDIVDALGIAHADAVYANKCGQARIITVSKNTARRRRAQPVIPILQGF